MRYSLGACSGLLCALLAVAPRAAAASEITFPAISGGEMAFDRVYGEILTSIPDQRVDEFSFWLVDPGASTGLNYRMGICATNTSGRASSVLFETDAQTLASSAAGASHRVTASTGGLVLDPSTYYFFYLLPTEPVDAPWAIQSTLTNYGPGGRGGKMGLTQWNTDKFHNDILETPFDRDLHFNASFGDPQRVPEPSVLVLMGLGGAALLSAKRRRRSGTV